MNFEDCDFFFSLIKYTNIKSRIFHNFMSEIMLLIISRILAFFHPFTLGSIDLEDAVISEMSK